ncbi:MAG: hypothetical protein ABSG16_17855 [Candidatus Acidiferrum sp.]|jgi:ElaB/YqjD/DUF883 family membrane-anchored ribosome-binding protein
MTESITGAAVKKVRKISDAVSDVTESGTDIGRHAAEKIESIRETVAGTIDETSSALLSSGKQISEMADVAAQTIQDGADYVRETDLRVMGADAKRLVKRYPLAAVAVGLGLGFLLAWSLRRND